jgi:cytochrome P450
VNDLPVLDLEDQAFWQDIYPDLAAAREKSPIVHTSDGGLYLLRYRQIDEVLKSSNFLAADLLGMMGLDSGPVWEWWQRLMFSNNDPVHGRLRRLVTSAFTPRRIERERESVALIVEKLLGDALERGETDVMTTVAHHLPSQVMADLFRIPESDREGFVDWTTDIGLAFGAASDSGVRRRVEDALANLDAYVGDLIRGRRGNPGDDLLSELIKVEEEGERLSTRELIDLVENLLFAGHDTTRGSIGALLWLLIRNPDDFAAIRQDPTLISGAVEESLRYEAITFSTCRAAARDTEIAGMPIPAGTPVGLCLPSASRDPAEYDRPDVFDIRRASPHPPTFGAGAHYCIGAALARLELQELLSGVVRMTRDVTAADEPRWMPFAQIRRFEKFDATFVAA